VRTRKKKSLICAKWKVPLGSVGLEQTTVIEKLSKFKFLARWPFSLVFLSLATRDKQQRNRKT
jgi:hypothetical protein